MPFPKKEKYNFRHHFVFINMEMTSCDALPAMAPVKFILSSCYAKSCVIINKTK
jgi:hypothetical protein